MLRVAILAVLTAVSLNPSVAYGRVYVSPFVSMSSNKKIEPSKAGGKGKEDATNNQRTTYGINAGVSFWRLFSLQLSVGRSQLDKTIKTQNAVDDFDEIDYASDLNMNTNDPEAEARLVETTDKARVSMIIDPGFWIFIARLKAGVQATKRTVEATQNDVTTTEEPPITYKPHGGYGFGVRLGPRMKAMAEYSFFFYKFPETTPFEREVSISYTVSL